MTIAIGKRVVVVGAVLVLIGAAGTAGYALGHAALERAAARTKSAERAAFERGRLQGDEEGRSAIIEVETSQQNADSEIIDYLGWARSDWEDGRWYMVQMIKRLSADRRKIVAVNDRKLMSPGLSYSLCGGDSDSICWVEE